MLILFQLLNLVQDANGHFIDADRVANIAGETNWDPEQKNDVRLKVTKKDYPLGRSDAAAVTLVQNQVEESFDLSLSQPVMTGDMAAFLRRHDGADFIK